MAMDLSHKPHNPLSKYPTIHDFVTEMCTHAHISITKWCIVEYETGALRDLCDVSLLFHYVAEMKWFTSYVNQTQNEEHPTMMTWHGNGFLINGLLCGNRPGGFLSQKGSDTELWCCFDVCLPEQIVEQTVKWPVIWDVMMPMWYIYNE